MCYNIVPGFVGLVAKGKARARPPLDETRSEALVIFWFTTLNFCLVDVYMMDLDVINVFRLPNVSPAIPVGIRLQLRCWYR